MFRVKIRVNWKNHFYCTQFQLFLQVLSPGKAVSSSDEEMSYLGWSLR